jgi:predicted MPP superfamily phosphohydrolase
LSFNWAFVLQQIFVAALSGAVAAALVRAGRALVPTPPTWRRAWTELVLIGLALFVLGWRCLDLGYGRLLPNLDFPWTVGVGLAFYWGAVWWPLLVCCRRAGLRGSWPGRATLAAAALAVLVALWSTAIEPQMLECERAEIALADAGATPIRIAHVSDIQLVDLGAREEEMVQAVNAFRPHLIVLTGDYIATRAGEATTVAAMRSILARLQASHGIFATTSDSEDERLRELIFRGLPVHYLRNGCTTVDVEGVRVRVGGLEHEAPDWERAAGDARADELFVMACHTPDLAEETARRLPLVDLYLCGHTHGGQLQVPGFGPLLTMCENAPRRVAAGGVFHTSTGLPYLLSRGVGMEGDWAPRFRLNCRPHLFLLTVRGKAAKSP